MDYDKTIVVLPNIYCVNCKKQTINKNGSLEVMSLTYHDRITLTCYLCNTKKYGFIKRPKYDFIEQQK